MSEKFKLEGVFFLNLKTYQMDACAVGKGIFQTY